jgi:hypothetical protein
MRHALAQRKRVVATVTVTVTAPGIHALRRQFRLRA